MLKALKFEPRTTSWTRSDVNQINKILESVQNAINAIPAASGAPGAAAAAPSSASVNIDSGVGGASSGGSSNPTGTVLTDGITITGDGVSADIALIYPNSFFSLVAGAGINISGTWPDQTITATGGAAAPCIPRPLTVETLPFSYSPYTQLLPFNASTQFDCLDKVLTLPFADSPYSASL